MKRFHLHVSVDNLEESIQFYSTLFAERPNVRQSDYAKWMLEDPRMGSIPVYGEDTPVFNHGASTIPALSQAEAACCVPKRAESADACCEPKASGEPCCAA
jgi:hypothetical protein